MEVYKLERTDKINPEAVCHFCGNQVPKIKCDECGKFVLNTKLTTVIHVDKTRQQLCNFCESISHGKHTYKHNKKVFAVLSEREKHHHLKSNPTFAYLYIKELENKWE